MREEDYWGNGAPKTISVTPYFRFPFAGNKRFPNRDVSVTIPINGIVSDLQIALDDNLAYSSQSGPYHGIGSYPWSSTYNQLQFAFSPHGASLSSLHNSTI